MYQVVGSVSMLVLEIPEDGADGGACSEGIGE